MAGLLTNIRIARKYILNVFLWITIILFVTSCIRNPFGDSTSADTGSGPYKQITIDPIVHEINADSLLSYPAFSSEVKATASRIITYTGIKKTTAGLPVAIKLDELNTTVFTFGEGPISAPLEYIIPEPSSKTIHQQDSAGDFTLQHGIKVFAPVAGKIEFSQPFPALPMRMKDNSISDIQYLDEEQGLPVSYVSDMLEDKRGNFWFAMRGVGVCIYDGTYLRQSVGTEMFGAVSLFEDSQGNIWIGTWNGVYKYDGISFTQIFSLENQILATVFSITEDQSGTMWFGTDQGLIKLDGQILTHYTTEQGLLNNFIWELAIDKSGTIWCGTGQGINKLEGSHITHFPIISGKEYAVKAITEGKDGEIWIGTWMKGLFRFEGSSVKHYTSEEGLSSNEIYALELDSEGVLWMGTYTEGISKFDGEYFTHFTKQEGLSDNLIRSIIEDENKNIWFSSEGGGVMRLRKNSFSTLADLNDIGKGNIKSIFEDSEGNICFGISNVGLLRFNGSSFEISKKNDSVKQTINNVITSLTEDKEGKVWTGSLGYLQRFNGSSYTQYWSEDYHPKKSNVTRDVFSDKQGDIWMGTWGQGLLKFDGKTFTSFEGILVHPEDKYKARNSINRRKVPRILQDAQENIWFATAACGLIKYDGDRLFQYTDQEGPLLKGLTSIFLDREQNIWIGSREHGLIKFDGLTFTSIPLMEGTDPVQVRSIIEDESGRIWVGTQNGLFMLPPDQAMAYNVLRFGSEDGLKELSFNFNSVCLDGRNRIWWGTGGVITMLDLNKYWRSTVSPLVSLKNIQLYQDHIEYAYENLPGLKYKSVADFYHYPIGLELPYDLNHVTFTFSAIDWSGPQQLKYQYMLDGMESSWSPLSKESKADYRNIPPGSYTFKVKAIGGAYLQSEVFEYHFHVRRPWWASLVAYIVYGLILILAGRYYIKFIIQRERLKADYSIQQMEVEKMYELDSLKSRFFASISHEFRTPLTLILGPVNDMIRSKDITETQEKRLLHIMRRNASRLQELINQLLDISRLETGKMRVLACEGDLTSFVRTLCNLFLSLAESKEISFKLHLEDAKSNCVFDRDKTEKILTNLLSNAFKYTPKGGSVNLNLTYNYDSDKSNISEVIIKVEDSGEGIPEDHLEKVFDRFHLVNMTDTHNDDSFGIGLSLTKELVELLKGSISVESEVGSGSCFKLVLPVTKSYFSDCEWEDVKAADVKAADVQPARLELAEEDLSPGLSDTIINQNENYEVLIVEDNRDLRSYITQQLHPPYFSTTAVNGKEGLEIAYERIPDLVISDLMMPVMGGNKMCAELKEDPRTSHIPIIMLTAKADKRSKLAGLETGADDYMIKPFDAEELQVRVKNLISQRAKLREKFRQEFVLKNNGDIPISQKDQLIERILEIFDEHIDDSAFHMDELASLLGLSRAQLFRKVQALTGFTPNDFFRKIRLKKAAQMLESGHDNVSQVMYQVGFSNQSYFAKCFKELYNVSPSKYVKVNSQ